MLIKRLIPKAVCLFFLLLVFGCAAPPAVKVDVLPGFDALFDNRKGWTGADGAYSLSLSDDRTCGCSAIPGWEISATVRM